MMLVLQRYILRDLLKVFLLALLGVSAIMVVLMVYQVSSRGLLSWQDVPRMLPVFFPFVLPYTIPATILFTVTLVYGRFARDNEFDAARASGVHPLVTIVPAVAVAMVASLTVLYFAAELMPVCYYRIRYLGEHFDMAERTFLRMLATERAYSDGKFTLFAEQVEGRTAYRTRIVKRNEKTFEPEWIAYAESTTFRFYPKKGVVTARLREADVWTPTADIRWYDTHEQALPLPKAPPPKPRDRALHEIVDVLPDTEDPKTRRDLLVEVHLRLNMALSCLSLVLVGVPLALWFRRGHMLAAFLVALGPMLLFHVVTFVTKTFVLQGGWPPATPWVANAMLLAAAGALLWRLFRR